jgi:hypothetical protein
MYKYFTSETSPLLLDLLGQIAVKSADHENFAKRCKSDEELIRELNLVCSKMFEIDPETTENSVQLPMIEKLSLEFNVQIKLYDDEKAVHIIKKNKYMNALVISIYAKYSDGDYKYFSLYHENYKIIAPENLNAALDYDNVETEKDDLRILDEFTSSTFRILFHRPPRSEMRKEWANVYYELKKKHRKTWGFEKKLTDVRKSYAVSLEKCVLCEKIVHRYKFVCNCGFCLECLNAFSMIDNCPKCNKRLKRVDTELIDSVKF